MMAPAFWRNRSARERQVLGWGGALSAALLFIALAWLPLARTHTRLEREMPAVRASLEALQRQADEVRRLRAVPAIAVTTTSQGGLPPLAGAQVATLAPGRLRVTVADIAFNTLIDWITAAQAAQGLRVDSARIDALPVQGRVRADLTLQRP